MTRESRLEIAKLKKDHPKEDIRSERGGIPFFEEEVDAARIRESFQCRKGTRGSKKKGLICD